MLQSCAKEHQLTEEYSVISVVEYWKPQDLKTLNLFA